MQVQSTYNYNVVRQCLTHINASQDWRAQHELEPRGTCETSAGMRFSQEVSCHECEKSN